MATQRRTEGTQQDKAELAEGTSRGEEGAPETDDAYFSTETSAAQPDSEQPETRGQTGQALEGADSDATDARAKGSAQQGDASDIQKTDK